MSSRSITLLFLTAALLLGLPHASHADAGSSRSWGLSLGSEGSSFQFGQQNYSTNYGGYGGPAPIYVNNGRGPHHDPRFHGRPPHGGPHHPPHHDPRFHDRSLHGGPHHMSHDDPRFHGRSLHGSPHHMSHDDPRFHGRSLHDSPHHTSHDDPRFHGRSLHDSPHHPSH